MGFDINSLQILSAIRANTNSINLTLNDINENLRLLIDRQNSVLEVFNELSKTILEFSEYISELIEEIKIPPDSNIFNNSNLKAFYNFFYR